VTTLGNPAENGSRVSAERYAGSESLGEVSPRLRQIHEAAHEFGVFILDRTGQIITWNAQAATACGYSDDQIVGRNFACLYTEAEGAAGQPTKALERSVADGRFEEQATRLRRDGSSFWADVTITTVHDAAGNHCGFACMVRDLSARGSAERELQSRLSQQEAITRLGASSLEGGGLGELRTQAAMISSAGLRADLANVLELDADGYLTLAAISHPAATGLIGMKLQGGRHSLSGYTLFSNEPVISEDLLAETRFQPHQKLLAYGARSGISVAIKSKGAALGARAANFLSV
jgi:PAS domain S-box-containing protein